jgi:hypothetical protein
MSWDREFPPEYEPHPGIVRIVDLGWAQDMSWHNDTAPSFGLAFPDETLIRIWSHPENPEDREEPEWPRFLVSKEGPPSGEFVTLIDTDDAGEAILEYRRAIEPYLKKWARPHAWSPRRS